MAYNGSIGKSSNGLIAFMSGRQIEYLDSFSVTPGSAPTFDVSTFNSTVEELQTGLRSADTISITGRFTPSPMMRELDDLSKTTETRNFSFITHGGSASGYYTGKGFDRLGSTVKVKTAGAFANGVTTVVFANNAEGLGSIAVGDYLTMTTPKVAAQIVKRSANDAGELVIEVDSDISTGATVGKDFSIVAPAARTNVIASVTSFAPLPVRNDVQNFSLELQATGSAVYVYGTPDVDVSDLNLPS